MAEIPFKQTSVSQIQAPDITKAGALFSKALQDLGTTAQQFQEGRTGAAVDRFSRALTQAKTQEELSALQSTGIPELQGIGVEPLQLTAAEQALKQRQVDVLGTSFQDEYNTNLNQNATVIDTLFKENPDYAQAVKIDKGFNVSSVELPPEATEEDRAKIQNLTRSFIEQANQRGFKGLPTEREALTRIREKAKKLNASSDQIKQLEDQFKTYREGLKTLNTEEQSKLDLLNIAVDDQVKNDLNLLEAQKNTAIATLGYEPEEAKQVFKTTRTDIDTFIDKNAPNWSYLPFWANPDEGGSNLKIWLDKYLKSNKDVPPWMAMEAIKRTIEAADQDVSLSDFKNSVERIKNSDLKSRLEQAINLDIAINQKKLAIEQRAALTKQENIKLIQGASGIRIPSQNRDFFAQRLEALNIPTAPSVSSSPLTDTAIAGQPIPESQNTSNDQQRRENALQEEREEDMILELRGSVSQNKVKAFFNALKISENLSGGQKIQNIISELGSQGITTDEMIILFSALDENLSPEQVKDWIVQANKAEIRRNDR